MHKPARPVRPWHRTHSRGIERYAQDRRLATAQQGLGHDDEALVIEMLHGLAHRGPDEEPGKATSRRRSGSGAWPSSTWHGPAADGQRPTARSVVFNGEIYNYHELREDLRSAAATTRTHSDTEIIVHLYEEYGDDLVDALRGMFAFALWDERRQRLVAGPRPAGQQADSTAPRRRAVVLRLGAEGASSPIPTCRGGRPRGAGPVPRSVHPRGAGRSSGGVQKLLPAVTS